MTQIKTAARQLISRKAGWPMA